MTNKTPRKRTAATKIAAVRLKTASNCPFISRDDPLGSYTGTPDEIDEQPVQDVDDL